MTNLGGGLYQNNLTSTVTSCIFAENSALQSFSGEGGGVYRNGVRGDLTNIYFENNDAALNGGGVFQVRRGNACRRMSALCLAMPQVVSSVPVHHAARWLGILACPACRVLAD